MIQARRIFIFLIMTGFIVSGCAKKKTEKYSEMKSLFGTQIRIDVCADPARTQETAQVLAKVWTRLDELQKNPKISSELSKVPVQFKLPTQKLDASHLAGRYGVDQAVGFLQQLGMKNFLIETTGDIFAGGKNCQGNPWRVGVKNANNRAKILDVVLLSNQAVATLGRDDRSVTVIAPSSKDAYILASASSALKPEQAIELIDSLGKGYASTIVYKEGETGARLKSKTYGDYQIKY